MKYPELKEFHDAYRKAGYDPSLFEALVTTSRKDFDNLQSIKKAIK